MSSRDSLHEADMWAVEGLTHRYPTKVLAELIPTCPAVLRPLHADGPGRQRHARRSSSTSSRSSRTTAGTRCSTTCGRRRRCATWSSPAATWRTCPIKRLEDFVSKLLDIENIRDIRIASKGLMGLPQHFLQDDVRAGLEAMATKARSTRRRHRAAHARELRAAGDAARRQGGADDARGRASATCATRACCCGA